MNVNGLTREEIITHIKTKAINDSNIISAINGMKIKSSLYLDRIKIGDVYNCRELGNHPCLVIKMKNNLVYSLMLTTNKETIGIIERCESRFYPLSFITQTLIIKSEEYCITNFHSVFENNKQINYGYFDDNICIEEGYSDDYDLNDIQNGDDFSYDELNEY